jgi:cytochrome c6
MTRLLVASLAVLLSTAALADGAETFAKKCAVCHGKEGSGGKIVAKPIAGTAKATVLKAVNEGVGKMKPVKLEDAAAVADYVAGLKK